MTLQQLRYLLAIAKCGSICSAAHELYVSQSSLSVAVKDIERECGIKIFERSSKGTTITNDGIELLSYARQIVEQADLMESRYSKDKKPPSQRLAIASQHYAFPVEAFLEFVEEYEGEGYTFSLRETRTQEVIEDVREFRADVGIMYTSSFNEQVITRALDEAGLVFTELFTAQPHIFVGSHHPLSGHKLLKIEDLNDYPRYEFEQGSANSFYYAEEPLAYLPHKRNVRISDRGTLTNLLTHHSGYTISTGVLSSEMLSGIVSIPLDIDQTMQVGYIMHNERRPSQLLRSYIANLRKVVEQSPMVSATLDPFEQPAEAN